MKRLCLCLPALFLAGCARFHSQPLLPAETAERLEQRSLEDPGLRAFLEKNLHRELASWPQRSWSFEMLTLAAFYYHPSLEVARAQWAGARGTEVTAAQRPNPTLNVTPGYDTSILSPSPWLPLGFIDVPIETAGKRTHRRARAAHLAEAARMNVVSVAWQVRGNLRVHLLELSIAQQRAALLQSQRDLQEQIVQRLDQQVQAGAIARSETLPLRIALVRTRLDLAEAQRQQAEARARVAEAIGIPSRALEPVALDFEPIAASENLKRLTSTETRRAALVSRPDVLSALAEYAAAQSALALEIARQYPDIHLEPGYQFDQGQNKWTLGLVVELPVLHQNQGPIAEAQAHRQEAAARFLALQAKVLADLDHAEALLQASLTNSDMFRALTETQTKQRDAIAAQVKSGASDQLSLLSADSEYVAAQLVRLEGQLKLEQAVAALEDAIQRPLPWPDAVFKTK
jgi:outer membrane protein, heavy metal efflux system